MAQVTATETAAGAADYSMPPLKNSSNLAGAPTVEEAAPE